MTIETIIKKARPARIMLVEDNFGDVLLAKKAFTKGKITNDIVVAKDGEEAMDMLRRVAPHENLSMPDLILLDLNIPKKSGRQVLEEIKEDPQLKHIPVVILTSSKAEMDVVKSYKLHANGYIVKPVNLDKFGEIVNTVEQFWFSIVILPDEEDANKAAHEN